MKAWFIKHTWISTKLTSATCLHDVLNKILTSIALHATQICETNRWVYNRSLRPTMSIDHLVERVLKTYFRHLVLKYIIYMSSTFRDTFEIVFMQIQIFVIAHLRTTFSSKLVLKWALTTTLSRQHEMARNGWWAKITNLVVKFKPP